MKKEGILHQAVKEPIRQSFGDVGQLSQILPSPFDLKLPQISQQRPEQPPPPQHPRSEPSPG